MEDLALLQSHAGHAVEFFGMGHEDNEPRTFEADFPSQVDYDPMPSSSVKKVAATARMLWSRQAERGMRAVLDRFAPDVVHVHNIYHQLSPSVLRPLMERRIPAVMTVHDYKLVCPSYQLLDHGKICEACLGGHFHHAPLRRCKDGSVAASLAVAVELAVHTRLGAYRPVTRFICPSRFMRDKLAAGGVFPDRLRWVPHFVDASTVGVKEQPGAGVIAAGRLSAEKGFDTLIRAVAGLRPDARLDLAGDGPARQDLERLAADVAPGRVRFHGRLAKPELHQLMRGAAVMAVPSRWHENQPMIVLEAFACGLPVVGSDLGGIPELIEPGVDGELAPADDAPAWRAALDGILAHPDRALTMGRAARAKVELEFGAERHLAAVEQIYEEAAQSVAA